MRQPLYMLLTIVVRPFTCGCQQVAPRVWKMIGRASSSCNVASISQTSCLRLSWSVSRDCRWNRFSSWRLQYPVKLRSESHASLS